jgi:endonuclease-3
MFCGVGSGLPLESNGLRVLMRVSYGRAQKDYNAACRSVQEAMRVELPPDPKDLACAHLLLREHGKTICKTNAPPCRACPAVDLCSFPAK